MKKSSLYFLRGINIPASTSTIDSNSNGDGIPVSCIPTVFPLTGGTGFGRTLMVAVELLLSKIGSSVSL